MKSTMHIFVVVILCLGFLYPSVRGRHFIKFPGDTEKQNYDFDFSEGFQNDTLNNILDDSFDMSNNVSEHSIEEQRLEPTSNISASETNRTEKSNLTFTSSSTVPSIKNTSNTQNTGVEVTEILSNESNSTSSVLHNSSLSSSTEQTKPSTKPVTSSREGTTVSSTEDDEQEGVVRGKPSSTESANSTTSEKETLYQKALALMSDTYTLSILIPVATGVVFASTILITIATCKCLMRQCRRRRVRRKTLPDSVKHFRPSDRARLLAESSDDEF